MRLIGDVSLIKLGMSEEEFVHLSSEVKIICVLNCLFSEPCHVSFAKVTNLKQKRRHCLKLLIFFCSNDFESPLNKV